jgi:molybdopterin/thiamine biosynthesis adenylyltransferase
MIDTSRHVSVFDPLKWNGRIDVIGVGATGSKIAMSLAKLGVRGMHVWDGDIVEDHNLANQAYIRFDVGGHKTHALMQAIISATGTKIATHQHHWLPEHASQLGEVVFCMVDSMAVRRQLFDATRRTFGTRLVIDSRMGSDSAQLLTYVPQDSESRAAYEATLFSDDDAHVEVSACGTSITVGPTGDIISGYAVWHFIRHAAGQAVEREIVLGAKAPSLEVL